MSKGQITVDTAQLDNVAEEVKKLADNYLAEYKALYEYVNDMKQAWAGIDNDAYTNQIIEFQDDFRKMEELMREYSEFLKSAAEKYRQTQADIKSKAQQLTINA